MSEAREFVERKATMTQTAESARLILSSYPQASNMANPDCYVAQVVALLSTYPPEVVERLAAPVNGIVSKTKWLPSVAEIKEEADRLMYVARKKIRIADEEIAQVRETKRLTKLREAGVDPFEHYCKRITA